MTGGRIAEHPERAQRERFERSAARLAIVVREDADHRAGIVRNEFGGDKLYAGQVVISQRSECDGKRRPSLVIVGHDEARAG